MLVNTWNFIIILFLNTQILITFNPVDGFANILSEIFDDLRIGSLDKDYFKQKLDYSKLKCLQGSYFFNGSCYVVSNKKHSSEFSSSLLETDALYDLINKRAKKPKLVDSKLNKLPINMAIKVSSLPYKAGWRKSVNYCSSLNNDSSLIHFNNDQEFEFLIDLLKKLNFPNLINEKNDEIKPTLYPKFDKIEHKYFIGLSYEETWKWINGLNLTEKEIEKYSLNEIRLNDYRRCAFLNLRDDGEFSIELANCVNQDEPYICKYVLDRCFNNTFCGKNGECVNVPGRKTFECRCRIFYDGDKCQNWSDQGFQMLITVGLVIFAFIVVILVKLMNYITFKCTNSRK